jgi:hypothetical protein
MVVVLKSSFDASRASFWPRWVRSSPAHAFIAAWCPQWPCDWAMFYVFWRISLNFIIFHFKISVLYKIGKLANSPVKDELRKLGCAVKFGN